MFCVMGNVNPTAERGRITELVFSQSGNARNVCVG